jgi:heme exporter protein D
MIDLGPHWGFIVAGYAGVTLGTLALIVATWWRRRAVEHRLAALEAQGVRRRSAGAMH